MKLFLKILSAVLLLFNGTGAVYGGLKLIMHPDGSSLGLTLDWLKHSPFEDYLIPGIVLFICNGLFSILVLVSLLLRFRYYQWLIIVQGAILTGWINIQMYLIKTIYFLHVIMGCTGIALMILGILLLKTGDRELSGAEKKS